MAINNRDIKIIDNETPVNVISIGDNTIRLYWTPRGIEGHQILMVVFFADGRDPFTYRTTGGNYCKRSSAISYAWEVLGIMPKLKQVGGDIHHKYHVGGNFYRVPKSHIRKYKRG